MQNKNAFILSAHAQMQNKMHSISPEECKNAFFECILYLTVWFEKKLPYVVTRDVCPSVCLSVCLSVRPSSVEISLERGCSITNMPIDLKFGPIIGSRVMHV